MTTEQVTAADDVTIEEGQVEDSVTTGKDTGGGDSAHVSVTMLGSLPPWKGITPYCREIFDGLRSTGETVEFINWRNLYPRRFYPGGDPRDGSEFPTDNDVNNVLSWWNPITWILAGLRAEGDIVHAQWWSYPLIPVYFTVLTLARLRGKQVVVTVHNVKPHEESKLNNLLNRLLFVTADWYIVHSEENKRMLCSEYDVSPDQVTAVPHPVLQSAPKRGVSRPDAKAHLDIDTGRDVILLFGGIRDYKGLDTMLEGLPAVVETHPNTLLVVAGACWDDWDKYEEIIQDNQLEGNVRTDIGYVPDEEIEYYFAAASVVVFPYKHFEAQSGVASLSNYFDRYSLGFDKGGLGDQLSETVESPDSLVARLIELLETRVPSASVEDSESINRRCIEAHRTVYRQLSRR